MPSSGKSTLGLALSELLGYGFFDLDKEITNAEAKSITEIFDQQGEEYFRELEHLHLQKLISINKDFVLACGGGTPCFYENINLMNKSGITVFLDIPLHEIQKRILAEGSETRPLLANQPPELLQEKLAKLYQSRKVFYQQANLSITAADADAKMLAQLINSFKN